MPRRFYKGSAIFANEDDIDYYLMYSEGKVELVRVIQGTNPEYTYPGDRLAILNDISQVRKDFREEEHHRETISVIKDLISAVENKNKKLENIESITSNLSINSGNLCCVNKVLPNKDVVKDMIQEDKLIDRNKEKPEFKLISTISDLMKLDLDNKDIAEFCDDEVNILELIRVVEEYRKDNNNGKNN